MIINGTESGMAKKVATFGTLISTCKTFEAGYNPAQPTLTVQALMQQFAIAQDAMLGVSQAKSQYEDLIDQREIVSSTLRPLATRIINAAAASGITSQALDHVKSVNIKIQGKRVKTIVQPDAQALAAGAVPVKTKSVSQQSVDSMIEHYTNLISTLETQPKYKPNEEELKLASLSNLLNDLKVKNAAAIDAYNILTAKRIARDKVLTQPEIGLIDTARDVKQYVKSVFGPSSRQFKQLSALRFA